MLLKLTEQPKQMCDILCEKFHLIISLDKEISSVLIRKFKTSYSLQLRKFENQTDECYLHLQTHG